jgi:AcrR family transcriptional regulator
MAMAGIARKGLCRLTRPGVFVCHSSPSYPPRSPTEVTFRRDFQHSLRRGSRASLLLTERSVALGSSSMGSLSSSLAESPQNSVAPPQRSKRYQEILEAAFEEFAANGYESTRLDDVANRAGIAKGTIYLYFKNKELLFRTVLQDQIGHIVRDCQEYAQESSIPTEDLIRELLSQQYSHLVQDPKACSIVRLLIAESRKFPQLADIYYDDVVLPRVSALRFILEKRGSGAESKQFSISEFPQILLAPGILAVLWSLIFADRHPLNFQAYKEAHLQLVLNALRGPSEWPSTVKMAEEQEVP